MPAAFKVDLLRLLALSTLGAVTVSVLVLDASGSMRDYGDAPQDAVNNYLNDLRQDATQFHAACIVTFADDSRVEVPLMPVGQIPRYASYRPGGQTLLYRTAKRVIEGLMDAREALSPADRERIRIVVVTISDGADNKSSKKDYPEALVGWSQHARDRKAELMSIGIGIDGKALARDMGFDPALASTVEASHHGVILSTRLAGEHATRRAPNART